MTDETIATENQSQPTWYIDDGIPGVGNRPDWLNEKFKSAADLAKSYHELEKKFGSTPEEYNIKNSKFLDPDYAPIQDFLSLAKDKRVPKDVIDKMVESIDKYMDEFKIDYSEETKKLGENAKERLTTLDNWAKANLSKESYEALTGNLKSAESIKALEELRGKMMSGSPIVPNGIDNGTSPAQTIEDIKTEIGQNLVKYKTDPAYQKDIRTRLELAAKQSNILDKVGP